MAAIATRNEVQAGAIHRVQRRMNCFAPDHRNRCRRQAGNYVGVVRRRLFQMRPSQLAGVAIAQTIDDGRVGLQLHAQRHSTYEDAGNLPRSCGTPVSFSTSDAMISA